MRDSFGGLDEASLIVSLVRQGHHGAEQNWQVLERFRNGQEEEEVGLCHDYPDWSLENRETVSGNIFEFELY